MTGSTITRWFKTCLQEAGISTGVFKAHPVQGTASSKASQYGMTVWTFYRQQIDPLRAPFRKFYHHSTDDKNKFSFWKAV